MERIDRRAVPGALDGVLCVWIAFVGSENRNYNNQSSRDRNGVIQFLFSYRSVKF